MTDKAFCESTDGTFDRSIAWQGSKSVSRVCIPLGKKKNAAPSMVEVVINWPSSSWMITLP